MADNLTIEQAMDAIYRSFGGDCLELDTNGGEFTAIQYARRNGIKYNTAVRQLMAAVAAGALIRRVVVYDGHRCYGYKIVAQR